MTRKKQQLLPPSKPWKGVKQLEQYYVYEDGEVERNDGHIMKSFLDKDGYRRVAITLHGQVKKFHVHRLVYMQFVGPLESGQVVRHMDSCIANNHYANLKQGTQKQNIHDKLHNKTWQAGDAHPRTRYGDHLVLQVREMRANHYDTPEICAALQVPATFVYAVDGGRRKTTNERVVDALESACFTSE